MHFRTEKRICEVQEIQAQLHRLKAAYGVATMGAHSFDCVDKRHSDSREFVLLGDARLHAGDPASQRF